MNILFANYGDFATNSTSHIAGFAGGLARLGHACVVGVPWGVDTVRVVPEVSFKPVSFHDLLHGPSPFPDGRPADIVHAWTPREIVRQFVLRYAASTGARLVVHLEDNEDYLFSAASGLPLDGLLDLEEDVIRQRLADGLSHPRRARLLLHVASGVTTIVPTLRKFVPAGMPAIDLPPGVDFSLFQPGSPSAEHRQRLGFVDGEKCIVYTGSTSFANAEETRDLYEAVAVLNRRGVPTRLVRTGADDPEFVRSLSDEARDLVIHLGFIPRSELPGLIAQADVLVQPGRPGPFNDFRLPSKIPEYLASGRPVVMPASNIGLELRHEADAIILDEATPGQIADACLRIFRDSALATRLGEGATRFARARFDGAQQARRLADFYASVLSASTASHQRGAAGLSRDSSEIGLAIGRLTAKIGDPEQVSTTSELVRLLEPIVQHLDRPSAYHADFVRVERDRDDWRKHFEDARDHAQNLKRRHDELIGEIDGLKLAHAVQFDQLRQDLAQRDEKIARMSATLSWRMTMPLRAFRRWLLSQRRQTPANNSNRP